MNNSTYSNHHLFSLHYSMFNIRYSIFNAVGFLNAGIPIHFKEKPFFINILQPNFTNPFVGSTMVNYELTQETTVEICVYDYTGKIVKTLKEGSKETGKHTTKLHAGDLAPGIYFCAIKCDGILSDTQKITIIK